MILVLAVVAKNTSNAAESSYSYASPIAVPWLNFDKKE